MSKELSIHHHHHPSLFHHDRMNLILTVSLLLVSSFFSLGFLVFAPGIHTEGLLQRRPAGASIALD